MASEIHTQYGNTGFTHEQALAAGLDLAADTLKVRPRNVAGLSEDQLESIKGAAHTAESAYHPRSAEDIFKALGATWLRASIKQGKE